MTDPLSQRVQAAVRDALATTSQNTSAGLDVSADLITSAVLAEVHRQPAAVEPPADRYRAAWQSAQRGRREARAELARLLHETQERIAELERLRARLDDVHRTPQDNITPAEVRLEQYGRRTKTWSTATYDSGTEKALHEIACQLRDALEETRDQRNSARLKVMGLEARVAELEKAAVEARAALGSLCCDLEDPGTAAFGALHLLTQATTWTETGPDFAAEALAQRDAKVLREAQDRIAELEDRIAAEECCCPEPAPLCEGCRCRCHADEQRPADRLKDRQDRHRAELTALRNDSLAIRGVLAPAGRPRRVPFELGESLLPAVEWLLARVSELEERLAEYERPVDEEPVPYELAEQPEEVTR